MCKPWAPPNTLLKGWHDFTFIPHFPYSIRGRSRSRRFPPRNEGESHFCISLFFFRCCGDASPATMTIRRYPDTLPPELAPRSLIIFTPPTPGPPHITACVFGTRLKRWVHCERADWCSSTFPASLAQYLEGLRLLHTYFIGARQPIVGGDSLCVISTQADLLQ